VTTADCPFCAIVAGRAPATIVHEWPDAIAFVPLKPVVDVEDGHLLVVPRTHVADFTVDPDVSAASARAAAELGRKLRAQGWDLNQITSAGRWATQTVPHLHLHLVVRREDDGLPLPWSPAGP
jgi:histidine triad (HIT) family protein